MSRKPLPPLAGGRKITPHDEMDFDDEKVKKLLKAAKRDLGEFFDVHMDRAQKGAVSRVNVVEKQFTNSEADGLITAQQLKMIEDDEDIFHNSQQRKLYRKDFIRGIARTENDALLGWIEVLLVEKARPRQSTLIWLKYQRRKVQLANYDPPKPAWLVDEHMNKHIVEAMEHVADCEDRKLGICSQSQCKFMAAVLMHNLDCEYKDTAYGTVREQLIRIFEHKDPNYADKVDALIMKNVFSQEEYLQEVKARYGLPPSGSWCKECRRAEMLQRRHKRHCRRNHCRIPQCGFPLPYDGEGEMVTVPVKITKKMHLEGHGDTDDGEDPSNCRRAMHWCWECWC